MKNINLKEVRRFIEKHQYEVISSADIVYSLCVYSDMTDRVNEIINDLKDEFDEEVLWCKKVEECSVPDELVNLMRKPVTPGARELLRTKLLQNEELVLPLIKEKSLRNLHDIFIENAVMFFIKCKTNCSEWIMENYSQFRSEYLKSLICLALGFRGDLELISFLMERAEFYEWEYPEESFERGPALAVEELYYRFINKK